MENKLTREELQKLWENIEAGNKQFEKPEPEQIEIDDEPTDEYYFKGTIEQNGNQAVITFVTAALPTEILHVTYYHDGKTWVGKGYMSWQGDPNTYQFTCKMHVTSEVSDEFYPEKDFITVECVNPNFGKPRYRMGGGILMSRAAMQRLKEAPKGNFPPVLWE